MTGHIMNRKTGWWFGDVIFRNREQDSGGIACHCVLVFNRHAECYCHGQWLGLSGGDRLNNNGANLSRTPGSMQALTRTQCPHHAATSNIYRINISHGS